MTRFLAFDLDGVICTYNPRLFFKQKAEVYYADRRLKIDPGKFTKPGDQWCIITGRPPRYRAVTEAWLYKHHLDWVPLYMVGNNFEYDRCIMLDDFDHWDKFCAYQKAYCLDFLGVEVYYEDKKLIADIIKKVCPDVKIRLVK